MSAKALKGIWRNMQYRCYDSKNKAYRNYGARGIEVCDRWRGSFESFCADMGPRPSPKHSIDRINNDGNYEPSNCRWATIKEQVNNTRANVRITHNGETLTLAQWADKLGLPLQTIYARNRRGWPIDQIATAERKPRINEINRAMTECKYGHPFTPENTKLIKKGARQYRRCRTCLEAYQREYNRTHGRNREQRQA